MTIEENKTLARQLVNSYNMENPVIWDHLCAPECVVHINLQDWTLEPTKQYLRALRGSFPDEVFTIEDMFAEGDKVAVRYTWQGTHKGTYQGIAPTGKKVTLVFLEIIKILKGKVVESWEVVDLSQFYAQLGITASPATAKK
jgi:predicted ester cyclase